MKWIILQNPTTEIGLKKVTIGEKYKFIQPIKRFSWETGRNLFIFH